MTTFQRNVPLLAIAQALMMSGTSMLVTTAALVGALLAEDKSLATLPLAAQFIATMFASIPAALLMGKIGRQSGFLLATLFGMAGSALATLAILWHDFWLFNVAALLIGIFNAFGNYYRFTAADAVDEAHKSRAISLVLAGGVAAAFIGPNMANLTRDWIGAAPFAGSYAALISLYVLSLLVLIFLRLPPHGDHALHDTRHRGRPLRAIMSQPRFIVALLSGMFGYGVMSLVMTATPLAMYHHAHPFNDTSLVIQWHILGMFVPSFFTGHLIRRFGVLNIILTGTLFGVVCVLINLNGDTLWHFWTALVLLGISWNFMFIGATTLLTETYTQEEKTKAQAVNDFSVFTTVTIASLSAGVLQHHYGWQTVNLGVLPLLLIILLANLWLRIKENRIQSGKIPAPETDASSL